MTGIRAVLLDLDDTLLPDSGAFLTAAAALAEDLGAPPELAAAVRRAARAAWRAGPHFAWFQTIGVSSWEGLWAPLGGGDSHMQAIQGWASGYRWSAWSAALVECGHDAGLAAGRPTASSTTGGPPAPRTPTRCRRCAGFVRPAWRRSS